MVKPPKWEGCHPRADAVVEREQPGAVLELRSLDGIDARPGAFLLQLAVHGHKAMLLSSTCKAILIRGGKMRPIQLVANCGQFEMEGYHGDGNVLYIVLQPIVIIILERSEWKGVTR